MPYIPMEKRQALDHILEQVDPALSRGEVNYLITNLLLLTMPQKNYQSMEQAVGTLEMVKLEFYRRMATPYEMLKVIENGDVAAYAAGDQAVWDQLMTIEVNLEITEDKPDGLEDS